MLRQEVPAGRGKKGVSIREKVKPLMGLLSEVTTLCLKFKEGGIFIYTADEKASRKESTSWEKLSALCKGRVGKRKKQAHLNRGRGRGLSCLKKKLYRLISGPSAEKGSVLEQKVKKGSHPGRKDRPSTKKL